MDLDCNSRVMYSISRECPSCKKFSKIILSENFSIICPQCSGEWGKVQKFENVFDRCPICQCRQFYLQKDFNQALGCLIMLIGIVLVPWTYGLSLPVFALFDWILHQRVPSIVVCYKCLSEFRGFKIPSHFKSFMHHIGARYDK